MIAFHAAWSNLEQGSILFVESAENNLDVGTSRVLDSAETMLETE